MLHQKGPSQAVFQNSSQYHNYHLTFEFTHLLSCLLHPWPCCTYIISRPNIVILYYSSMTILHLCRVSFLIICFATNVSSTSSNIDHDVWNTRELDTKKKDVTESCKGFEISGKRFLVHRKHDTRRAIEGQIISCDSLGSLNLLQLDGAVEVDFKTGKRTDIGRIGLNSDTIAFIHNANPSPPNPLFWLFVIHSMMRMSGNATMKIDVKVVSIRVHGAILLLSKLVNIHISICILSVSIAIMCATICIHISIKIICILSLSPWNCCE